MKGRARERAPTVANCQGLVCVFLPRRLGFAVCRPAAARRVVVPRCIYPSTAIPPSVCLFSRGSDRPADGSSVRSSDRVGFYSHSLLDLTHRLTSRPPASPGASDPSPRPVPPVPYSSFHSMISSSIIRRAAPLKYTERTDDGNRSSTTLHCRDSGMITASAGVEWPQSLTLSLTRQRPHSGLAVATLNGVRPRPPRHRLLSPPLEQEDGRKEATGARAWERGTAATAPRRGGKREGGSEPSNIGLEGTGRGGAPSRQLLPPAARLEGEGHRTGLVD